MRLARYVAIVALGLTACSSAPQTASPPTGFPDLSRFTAETSPDFTASGRGFNTSQQISCVLDFGPHNVTVCSGKIRGVPDSVQGSGCVAVRKPDSATTEASYAFERSGAECVTSRRPTIEPGRKLTADNGTCAVGDDGLIACIDADNRHGFVLQSSGSWTF